MTTRAVSTAAPTGSLHFRRRSTHSLNKPQTRCQRVSHKESKQLFRFSFRSLTIPVHQRFCEFYRRTRFTWHGILAISDLAMLGLVEEGFVQRNGHNCVQRSESGR